MSEKNVKQVIVVRKDLKMRRGKEISQSCHGSIMFLTKQLRGEKTEVILTEPEIAWLNGQFTKVCLQVNSEVELLEIHAKALAAGLKSNLVTDSGKTEFDGVPTNTVIVIGPDYADKIDTVTGTLKLY